MIRREITWHNWSNSKHLPQPQSEEQALETQMGVILNLGSPQREAELFEQEGVARKDYVEAASPPHYTKKG